MKLKLFFVFTLLLAIAGILVIIGACEDSEEDDIDPPGADDDDNDPGEWNCPISDEGLDELVYYANCYDPSDEGNLIAVSLVRGTDLEIQNGERFEVQGDFIFQNIASGKIEPVIPCPGGSTYNKCSWPVNEKSGEFTTRISVSDCDIVDMPTEITINMWFTFTEVNLPVCQIYLGQDGPPVDDDTSDDDTSDDDTSDDDTSDDDATDDDATDDDDV